MERHEHELLMRVLDGIEERQRVAAKERLEHDKRLRKVENSVASKGGGASSNKVLVGLIAIVSSLVALLGMLLKDIIVPLIFGG